MPVDKNVFFFWLAISSKNLIFVINADGTLLNFNFNFFINFRLAISKQDVKKSMPILFV